MGFLFQGLKMNFFFRSLSWVLKKKGGQVHGDGVQICIIGGSKQFFFLNIIYIYIYNFGSGGSFDYNVPPPL